MFSVVDNEFYSFLRFGGFNMCVFDVGYYLLVYFIVFMNLVFVVYVYSVSIVIVVVIAILVDVMEIVFYLLINYFIGEVIIDKGLFYVL